MPRVSIVVETVTALFDAPPSKIVDQLRPTLAAVERQSWPADRIETIVVLDKAVPADAADRLAAAWPRFRFIRAVQPGYFAAKNEGAAAAGGEFVLLLDGDVVPDPDWVERLVGRFEEGVAVVAGRTRYAGTGALARLISVPDFAYVLAGKDGTATGFNLNNVAFRREVLVAHPLDARIRRNGACYLLFHQLRSAGHRIVYEPTARAFHALDGGRFGFLRKHFDRGYDSIAAYRADGAGLLRGSKWYLRFGGWALPPIFARRIAIDWANLVRYRRQMDFPLLALPLVAAAATFLRLLELRGALSAALGSDRRARSGSQAGAGECAPLRPDVRGG